MGVKRWMATIGILALMGALLLKGGETTEAVRQALSLCAQTVIPSLFPFFVASSLFVTLGAAESCQKLFSQALGGLLGCRGAGTSAFLLGAVGGYPTGARTVGALYNAGQLRHSEAEHLLAFCNNCGPAFILGIAGARFASIAVPWALYLIHVLSAIAVAQLFRRAAQENLPPLLPHTPQPPAGTALVQAVTGGAQSMLAVCGFVVFFQVLLRLAEGRLGVLPPWLCGFWELTGGMARLPDSRAGFLQAAALLGWGGVSVHCQSAAVLEGTGLSMKKYLTGKALQAAISALLAGAVWRWVG